MMKKELLQLLIIKMGNLRTRDAISVDSSLEKRMKMPLVAMPDQSQKADSIAITAERKELMETITKMELE
jgi:hypothetical protein